MKQQRKYFGTDGIRGRVGEIPMQPEFLVKLGWAIGKSLGRRPRARIVVGKDTRISGYLLESSIEAGLAAAGVDTYLLGPLPTPAVAYITRIMEFDAGIALSASHNPYEDNGLKIFSKAGFKLPDEAEFAIERLVEQPMQIVPSEQLGKAFRIEDALRKYIHFCTSVVPKTISFRGLKIVVDCANGAAYYLAPLIFRDLGMQVITIHDTPDGLNINKNCGALYLQDLQDAVKQHGADLGIAFDGDADRVMMVDASGDIVDGDDLLYIMAMHQKKQNKLQGGVVGTFMTNLGLERAFQAVDIPFIRTNIGDRHVLEALQKANWQLGGETSGHIIHLGYATTGDGISSALLVLWALVDNQQPLKEARQSLQKFPQHMINVKLKTPLSFDHQVQIEALAKEVESSLNKQGRVLLRPSGTEPVLRIMVEGEELAKVKALTTELAEKVTDILQDKR